MRCWLARVLVLPFVVALPLFVVVPAHAEWYVAGQFGVNFADQLSDIGGTGSLASPSIAPRFPSFDLKNSYTYGLKIGNFPGNGWFGLEFDAFHTTPHIKQMDEVPGIHLGVTNVGLNFIARYPGATFQPYVGIGGAAVIARLGNSPTTQSETDVGAGLNLLAGVRAFVTPYMAVFTEYKYTQATFRFDNAFGAVGGFIGDYQAQHVLVGVSYHF